MNTTFLKKLTVVLVAILFASCDKDYNSLGTDIIGNEHFDFGPGEQFSVKAYNQKVDAVQTNNLSINTLGIINSPTFGKSKSNFVTQLELNALAPVFGNNVVVDSVVLMVPYFSTKGITESDGRVNYTLDSIHNKSAPINLSVYRNGYYLRDFDPNDDFQTAQRYYSNQDPDFNNVKIGMSTASPIPGVGIRLNNDPDPKENIAFVPNEKEHVEYKVVNFVTSTTEVEKRESPRMRLHLDKMYFNDEIINASASVLSNNNAFKNYFRGLYFQVENASSGNMMSLDFTKGNVTIYYRQDVAGSNPVVKSAQTLVMNLKGNTVNLFENTDAPNYLAAVNAANPTDGDETLYLKGGQGAQAFVDIFDDLTQLATIKGKNYLINQATLTFTIDDETVDTPGELVDGTIEPQRLYLFDATNNRPLYDYFFDTSTNSSNFKLNKLLHNGIIKTEGTGTNKKGVSYKINITEHVNNIVNKDSANVRLGLVVTENINEAGNSFLKTPILSPKKFTRVPVSSIMNPLGTVLHGTSGSVPADKKVKFEIYYTKPN